MRAFFGSGAWRALILASATAALSGCGIKAANDEGAAVTSAATQASAHALTEHASAERARFAPYLSLATGRVDQLTNKVRQFKKHPWPIALLAIGHSNASYQNYGGEPYFHHGLDMRGDAGSEIVASAGGKVVNIENYMPGSPAYWEIAILDDEGFLWQYHHVDRRSIPRAIEDAYRDGTKIAAGTRLGEIYYWPVVTFGERYHHIHVNVLGADGAFVSPFLLLEDLPDTKAPEIVEIGILKNGQRWSGRSISGAYTLYATVHDLVLHDKFVVPAHALSYRVDGGDEVNVWTFDTLPGGASETKHVHDYFVRNIACGNYDCRKLAVNLGFSTSGTRAFPKASGEHTLEVIARDFAGNETTKAYTWRVD